MINCRVLWRNYSLQEGSSRAFLKPSNALALYLEYPGVSECLEGSGLARFRRWEREGGREKSTPIQNSEVLLSSSKAGLSCISSHRYRYSRRDANSPCVAKPHLHPEILTQKKRGGEGGHTTTTECSAAWKYGNMVSMSDGRP